MALRRYTASGAVFAWPLSAQPLQEARDRHVVTGNPVPGLGPWGPYLTFDGAADYITLGTAWGDALRFDQGTADFSVVVWVRVDTGGALQYFIDKRDGAVDGWTFYFNAADVATFRVDALIATAPAAVVNGNWHSIIATVDRDGNMIVCLDGAPGAGVAVGGEVMATTTAPRIGANSFDATGKFTGAMAGLVIFPRILTAAECLDIATGRAF